MQIHQILIRPEAHTVIILYMDVVGRRHSLVFDSSDNALVGQLIDQCKAKLPADTYEPVKEQVHQEITELEYRLQQLKASIGEAVT